MTDQKPRAREQVQSRNEAFTERTATKIWMEQPSSDNPYIASDAWCHGYNLIELMQKRSFVDVLYLLFRGELPSADDAKILEALMIGLINPGPRHPATRAAMNAGIGKTRPVHILPIAAAVLGGDHQGAGEIEDAMKFLRRNFRSNPETILSDLYKEAQESPTESLTPGFGSHYGGIDLLTQAIADQLITMDGVGPAVLWGNEFAQHLAPVHKGWLSIGIAAAVFVDLGFHPRVGGCLYQLISAPGLVAHGLEMANKPITAMPFIKDENYFVERNPDKCL